MKIHLPLQKIIMFFVIILCLFGCEKVDVLKNYKQLQNSEQNTLTPLFADRINNVTSWLNNKKTDFYSDSSFINNILNLMLVSDSYTESYNNESFLIIPLKSEGFRKVSSKIRSDLNFPLQFLLVVKDSSGNIRRADIAVFYPKSNTCQSLPSNFFKTFFEEQKLTIDGTLSLIGLKNQNIFEMTFKDGKPSEFKDWQERIAPVPSLVNPIDGAPECTDWYLVITTYWEDGTYSVAEIYLYTHCTGSGGGGGGGGGGGAPPPPTSSSIYVTVTDGRQGANGYMNFTTTAHYMLTGLKYLSPNSNIFTAISYEGIFTTWPFSMHQPGTPWEITTSNPYQYVTWLNSNKTANCGFSTTISFPSGNPYGPIALGNQNLFQASIIL